jgi:hypothetical protein
MAKKPDKVQWPADHVERWPIQRLRPNRRNPKKHSDQQIDEIAASILEFGFTNPILIEPDGEIIAGEGRWRAAKKMMLPDVPVMIAHGWTDVQRQAYVIADNALAEHGKWDDTLLALDIGDLKAAGYDIALTGLSAADVKRLSDVDEGDSLTVHEIATTTVADEFWITVRGPLPHQADALQAMQKAMAGLDGVSVDLGTIAPL